MSKGEKKWTVMRSIGFAAETSSTIGCKSDALKFALKKLSPGYGGVVPQTSEGRIVTMVFATILIPMNIYFHYLSGLGKY